MTRKSPLWRLYIALILALMYVPILLVIIYSFNMARLSSVWSGFTLKWYGELFRDHAMFTALRNSVILGALASSGAAVLGTLGAAGMARIGGAGPRPPAGKAAGKAFGRVMEYLSTLPIMIPEIILGMVFLAFFSLLGLPFGMVTLIIAHTAICVPYVYLLVKARLVGLDREYVEAAKNLGAGEWRAFCDITLPLVLPAVISGMLISFAMSFDDVIISVFLTGAQTNTLPIKIYSQMKTGVTPKTNALCTLLFIITVVLCLFSAYLARPQRELRHQHRSIEGEAT
ncbi:MAG: ABC transporter permease [Spirochaetaceae bacterium]|jgi:spermidine/putrescine transport system permease protein|nr:ABC transporter permease [Spirochaetaceae bacterium]